MGMDEQLARRLADLYRKEGVCCLKGVFKDWVELLRDGVERNLAEPGPFATESTRKGEAGRFFDDYCNWERLPEYREFLTQSPIARIAATFMQSGKAQLFHEHIVIKEAGTAKATPWHHDLPYYCVDGDQTVSVWIALDPVPLGNAVRFVKGSHLWGQLYFPRKFIDGRSYEHDDPDLAVVPDIDADPDRYPLAFWACEPGDAVLFNFKTLHGTSASPLAGRRRAIAFRFLGDDVRFITRKGETSPPYPGLNPGEGAPMPEDRFPVLWRV